MNSLLIGRITLGWGFNQIQKESMMKRFVLLLVISMIAIGFANTSYSQDIASSSYESVVIAPESKPTSGYDGGFFIGSEDGDFKLKLGARIEPMFYWQSQSIDDPLTVTENESRDDLTFRLRRAQIWLIPQWKDFSGFVLVGSAVPSGGNPAYWIANVTYEPGSFFSFKFGVDDPEYDLTSITSSKKLTMVDNTIVVTQTDGEQPVWGNDFADATTVARPSFGLPTQIAAFVASNWLDDRFRIAASVGNGSEGTDSLNTNRQFQYSLRMSYVILGANPYGDFTDLAYNETPALAFGVGGAFEHDDRKNTTTGLKMYNWSIDGTADIVFKWRGFACNIAGYYRNIKTGPGATIEAGEKYLTDVGYLATLSMFAIPKKLEFQAWGSQIIREGPDNNVYEFGGGANYYIKGHNVKFQIDGSRLIDYDDIVGTNNRPTNRVRAKATFFF